MDFDTFLTLVYQIARMRAIPSHYSTSFISKEIKSLRKGENLGSYTPIPGDANSFNDRCSFCLRTSGEV
jgi:hypothetical protein